MKSSHIRQATNLFAFLSIVSFVVAHPVIAPLVSTSLIAQQPQLPRFRSGVNLVLVDVVVRDRSGAVVTGLTGDDFELYEDGVRQQILTFAFESIGRNATPVADASVLAAAAGRGTPPPPAATTGVSAAAPGNIPSHPLTSDEVAGHRLLTLVFDTSSMQPEDVQKAVDGAVKWVDGQMTVADLVAVAAPMYVKFGLRNSRPLYPSGLHLVHEAAAIAREKVHRAGVTLEWMRRSGLDLIQSEPGARGLGIPQPPS